MYVIKYRANKGIVVIYGFFLFLYGEIRCMTQNISSVKVNHSLNLDSGSLTGSFL